MSEADSIRSDIEMTRRRMDDTVDALGERLHGRHLIDEVIGFFRSNDAGDNAGTRMREKISETAGNAASAVVDTVKKNPLPLLLITAGAAWLAYSATRSRKNETSDESDDDRYDPDTHYDRPLEYPGGTTAQDMGEAAGDMADEAGSKFQQMKDKASAATDQVKEKLSDLSDAARDKFESAKSRASEFGSRVRDRASEIGSQVQDKTREVYGQARDKVVQTADEHPLEVGLGCLAVGVLIGLAIPTPEPVNRFAGPTVDRLRKRTKDASKDIVQKGKRVVQAATDAVKHEAESQGLTFDRLRDRGEAVAKSAGNAAADAARKEGLAPQGDQAAQSQSQDNQRARSEPADPSAARPEM